MVEVVARPVSGLGEVRPGDDLGALVAAVLAAHRPRIVDGDVLCVASKIVAKAEGALVALASDADVGAARQELATQRASDVLAAPGFTIITRTHHGFVCANGGIDASNVVGDALLELPEDPDASARSLRASLIAATGVQLGVVITDTFGRAWRHGQTDIAIGCAGLDPIRDERGAADRGGRVLSVTEVAVADAVAGAADLVRSKSSGTALVVVSGMGQWVTDTDGPGAAALVRPASADLFARGRGRLAARAAGARFPGDPPEDPSLWVHPVTSTDLALAITAAEAAGATATAVDAEGAAATRLVVRGPDGVTAGLAAGAAAAALADCGWAVMSRPEGPETAAILAGAPAQR